MAKKLLVYWNKQRVGQLHQNDHGELQFNYDNSWLNNPASLPISCSLPLSEKIYSRKECQGFFEGFLPEEGNRRLIAKVYGISAYNDFAMLEKIGGECAGAITFISTDEDNSQRDQKYRTVNETELAELLHKLPQRPLLAGESEVRLSLAGVQDKIAVRIKDGQVAIPLDGSPSTHIIKPSIKGYEGLVQNEAFCLALANQVGINAAKGTIKFAQDVEYLLIERFDRISVNNDQGSNILRLHQEDFCQAQGIVSNRKYQNEGGPSLKQCFSLIRKFSSVPAIDLQHLLDGVIFNFLIGNCDAHGKNFSFILDKEIHLAPLYDLLSTTYYDNLSRKMAMKIGGEYNINSINIGHFEKLAEEIGFSRRAVRDRVILMSEKVLKEINYSENPVERKITEIIKSHCDRMMKQSYKNSN